METFTLYELNEYIKQVIALNFTDPVWIECEVSQVSHSRGNVFLELIEKSESSDDVIAQSRATIWWKENLFLKRKLAKHYEQILAEGSQVKIKIQVDFHERYGLSLTISDVDPTYTFGKLAIRRQEILEKLKSRGLLERNRSVTLPPVLLNVAVVSSEMAAGFSDFIAQLRANSYGYGFQVNLYPTAVQGRYVPVEITETFRRLKLEMDQYDCCVIIRGGGSKLELAAFDDYEVAKAIANCPLPVITGIGHEIDESVSDIVAHTALKTPTAVANFLIEHNMSFESSIRESGRQIERLASRLFRIKKERFDMLTSQFKVYSTHMINRMGAFVDETESQLPREARRIIRQYEQNLQSDEALIGSLDPLGILKRGYSITTKNSEIVFSKSQVKSGDQILTILAEDKFSSSVN